MWEAIRAHPVVASIVSVVAAVLAIFVPFATIWPVLSRDTVPEFLEKQVWLLTMPSWQVVVVWLISGAILVCQAAILRGVRRGVSGQDTLNGHLPARIDLRAAYSAIKTEISSIRPRVTEALETGSWWPTSMTLPAFAWQEHSSLLSRGESREEMEIFDACEAVFVLCDRANGLADLHRANVLSQEHIDLIIKIRNSIDKALVVLTKRLAGT